MQYEIKELSIGGILDQAVALTKNHFGRLFSIMLVLWVPLNVISALIVAANTPELPATATFFERLMAQSEAANTPTVQLLNLATLVIALPLSNAAIIHALASEYLRKSTSVGQAFGRAAQAFFGLIWTAIVWYFAIVGGFILCVIPGLIALYWFSFWSYVVVIEGTSGFGALKRSRFLIRGNFGTWFVLGVILFLIQVALGGTAFVVGQPHVAAIVNVFVQTVLFIFLSAAYVVFYFSCRCKAENFDLALLAQSVGEEAPPSGSSMGGESEAAPEF